MFNPVTLTPEQLGVVIVVAILACIVGLGCFVWYAIALSRLFPKVGGEAWKAWVPVLNEAEILARGGVPGWSAVYYFIPVVQLYGVYLKGVALLRINRKLGRGVGLMIVGLLLPPVWASIVGGGRPAGDEIPATNVRANTAVAPQQTKTLRTKPEPTMGAKGTDASGYAIPLQPSAQIPVEQAPIPAAPVAPPASALPPIPVIAEVPAPPVPMPAPDLEPEPVPDLAAHAEPEPEHSPEWNVRLDDGRYFAVTASQIELGRNPSSKDPATQLLAIDDSTRTLSKSHARLTYSDGQWTITDLKSTNGVVVVAADGEHNVLDSGASAVVHEEFILGDVGARLSFT